MRLKTVLAQMAVVAGEYHICTRAVTRLRGDMERDPTLGERWNIRRKAVVEALAHLENTYLVRAFALFEASLRELWAKAFGRRTEPPVRDLIDALAAARGLIPYKFLEKAHEVRVFRNSIVHLNVTSAQRMSLPEALDALRAYLSFMPRQW